MLINLIVIWALYIFIGIVISGLFLWIADDKGSETEDGGVIAFMIAFWPCVILILGVYYIAAFTFALSSLVIKAVEEIREWMKSKN